MVSIIEGFHCISLWLCLPAHSKNTACICSFINPSLSADMGLAQKIIIHQFLHPPFTIMSYKALHSYLKCLPPHSHPKNSPILPTNILPTFLHPSLHPFLPPLTILSLQYSMALSRTSTALRSLSLSSPVLKSLGATNSISTLHCCYIKALYSEMLLE